jgi:hypothetical protein
MRYLLPFFLVLGWTMPFLAQSGPTPTPVVVERALAAEMRTAQDPNHPMRYRLRKSSPRLTTVKEIVETRDGAVARLFTIGDRPLAAADEQKEQARLDSLLSDPGRQRHRKQSEDEDSGRALKLLRVLPHAFIYQFVGTGMGPTGKVEKFIFRPNPQFIPPDLETQVLTGMVGEIWIDASQQRVVRIEGHLRQDVNFGWGILGRLYKGGWIVLEQAEVSGRQWRIVRFQMSMNGRVLFRNKNFDTVLEETNFAPVPVGLNYKQAIQMLRAGPGNTAHASR